MSALIFLLLVQPFPNQAELDQLNAAVQQVYDEILKEEGHLVDYAKLAAEPRLMEALQAYADFIGTMDLNDLQDKNHKIAVLSNTYNVLTLIGVTRAWPVTSVRKIRPFFGFFKKDKWPFAGGKATLDDIENKHLRALDPRIHFIINCASASCPPLYPTVLTAENVEDIMARQTVAFLTNSDNNRYDEAKKTFYLSKIFDWFGSDFGGREGVITFVKEHHPEVNWHPARVKYLDYDWALNGPTGK